MKVYQILKQGTNLSSLDIECLVAKHLGQNRSYILAHPELKIGWWQRWKIQRDIKKREWGYPLHYLLGYKEFYGQNFFVNQSTLIPRPETEELIDILREQWRDKKDLQIIDLGTGSGCLGLTLATVLPVKQVYLVDISKGALQVAQRNADNLNLSTKVELRQSDLLTGFSKEELEKIDLLVANLPYLSEEQMRTISVEVRHEPASALVAGEDGLKYYRLLLEQLHGLQKIPELWIEFDPSQVEGLQELCEEKGVGIEFYEDLSGRERFGRIFNF